MALSRLIPYLKVCGRYSLSRLSLFLSRLSYVQHTLTLLLGPQDCLDTHCGFAILNMHNYGINILKPQLELVCQLDG